MRTMAFQVLVGNLHFRVWEQELYHPLTVLFTASMSRPLNAPRRWIAPCITDTRLLVRIFVQHSAEEVATNPK